MTPTASLSSILAQTQSQTAQNGRVVGDFADVFAQANGAIEGESPTLTATLIIPPPVPPAAATPTAALHAAIRQDAAATGNGLPTMILAGDPVVSSQPGAAPPPAIPQIPQPPPPVQSLAALRPPPVVADTLAPDTLEASPSDGTSHPVTIALPGIRVARHVAFVGMRRDARERSATTAAGEPTDQSDDAIGTATADASAATGDGVHAIPLVLQPAAAIPPSPSIPVPDLVAAGAGVGAGSSPAENTLTPSIPFGQPIDTTNAAANVAIPSSRLSSWVTGKAAPLAEALLSAVPAKSGTDEKIAPAMQPATGAEPRVPHEIAEDRTRTFPTQSLPSAPAAAPLVAVLPTQPILPAPVMQALAGIVPRLPSMDQVGSTVSSSSPAASDVLLASADSVTGVPRWTATKATTPVTLATTLPTTVQPQPGTVASASQIFGAAIQAATKARDDIDKADPAGTSAPVVALAPALAIKTADAQQTALDMRQERWPHAMIERIDMLRDAANATDTRIRLIPDALGAIDVSMRKDGDTVHVHFNAEQAATRTLLADAQPRLAELAEARGLKLGQGNLGDSSMGGNASSGQQRAPATANAPNRATAASAAIADATEDTRIA